VSDKMRWRYGDTNPVIAAVSANTVIEIGDLLFLDTDNAKPAALQANQATEAADQQLFVDKFLGVATAAKNFAIFAVKLSHSTASSSRISTEFTPSFKHFSIMPVWLW